MKRVIVVLAVIAQTMTLSAQSFLWHLKKDEPGKGSIVIKQDKGLEYLIDNRKPEIIVDTLPAIRDIQVEAPKTRRLRYDTLRVRPTMPDFPLKKKMLAHADSTGMMGGSKKIMSGAKKVTGYRIQLFAGGNTREDRQKAEAIGRRAKALFPSQPIYTHFYSPRWVCRMGNFEDFEEAQAALRRARNAGIKDASIIKGTITVKK